MQPHNEITIHISRREIRHTDVDRFRFLFDMRRQSYRGLPKLCGTLRPVFPQTEHEIFEDPHARRFCSKLYQTFPYWMLFLSLSGLTLWKMTLAVLDSIQIVERAGERRVSIDQVDANLFVVEQIRNCVQLSTRASPSSSSFQPQLERASRYYGRLIPQFSRTPK